MTNSKSYVALPKDMPVLGVDFVAFMTEQGVPVFSQTSFAKGMGMGETSSRRIRQLESMKAIASKSSTPATLKVKSGKGNSATIACMSLAEVTEGVRILAERGNVQAKSMMEASFATVLLLEVQRAFEGDKYNSQVLDQAAELRAKLNNKKLGVKELGEKREKHKVTHSTRTKVLREVCNLNGYQAAWITNWDYLIILGFTARQILILNETCKPDLAIEYLDDFTQNTLVLAQDMQTLALEIRKPQTYEEVKDITTAITQDVHDTMTTMRQRILSKHIG